MRSKLLSRFDEVRLFALVLDAGEEASTAIRSFAEKEAISGGSITAIGAFEKATVGWFDFETKDYRRIPLDEQCEVLSLLGDIGRDDEGAASLHLHAVLGLRDGSTRGGHFLDGVVKPTLEVMITETPAHLCRRKKHGQGLALLDLDRLPASASSSGAQDKEAASNREAMRLAEETDLSPNQAKELLDEYGEGSPEIEEKARNFKAES